VDGIRPLDALDIGRLPADDGKLAGLGPIEVAGVCTDGLTSAEGAESQLLMQEAGRRQVKTSLPQPQTGLDHIPVQVLDGVGGGRPLPLSSAVMSANDGGRRSVLAFSAVTQ
jgi:hypothetical protein